MIIFALSATGASGVALLVSGIVIKYGVENKQLFPFRTSAENIIFGTVSRYLK
jgi:hypothetical protein